MTKSYYRGKTEITKQQMQRLKKSPRANTATEPLGLVIFQRVARRHSNLCREDFGVKFECARERHETGRRSDEFGDILEAPPQPNPIPGRSTFAELARSDRASAPILLRFVRLRTSIQRCEWFLSF